MRRYPQPRRFLETMPLPAMLRTRFEPERSWRRLPRTGRLPVIDTTPDGGAPAAVDGSPGSMRIAVVTESFLPHVNGVTNSVLRVLEHLRAEGHEAVVIAPGRVGDGPAEYAGFPIVRVPSVPMPGYRQVRIGLVTRRRVVAELEAFQPDVVHLASPFVLGAVAARAAQHMDVPCVSVYQTDVAGFASRYHLSLAADAVWAHLVRIHERCDVTLAPSRPAMADLAEHDIPRVALWPRGVDGERFHPRHRDLALRTRLAPKGEVLVGYVGRLAREKKVHMLEALHDLPGVRLVLVGEGPYRPELERDLPGAAFLGFQGGEDLARLVASLDVMVHTGEHETFCQAVQEALASGVPVVAPASGGPLDLVEPGRTGWLYEPGDASDLRARVAALAADADMRTTFGRNARASVESRTWAAVCTDLMGWYDRALQRHRARQVA